MDGSHGKGDASLDGVPAGRRVPVIVSMLAPVGVPMPVPVAEVLAGMRALRVGVRMVLVIAAVARVRVSVLVSVIMVMVVVVPMGMSATFAKITK